MASNDLNWLLEAIEQDARRGNPYPVLTTAPALHLPQASVGSEAAPIWPGPSVLSSLGHVPTRQLQPGTHVATTNSATALVNPAMFDSLAFSRMLPITTMSGAQLATYGSLPSSSSLSSSSAAQLMHPAGRGTSIRNEDGLVASSPSLASQMAPESSQQPQQHQLQRDVKARQQPHASFRSNHPPRPKTERNYQPQPQQGVYCPPTWFEEGVASVPTTSISPLTQALQGQLETHRQQALYHLQAFQHLLQLVQQPNAGQASSSQTPHSIDQSLQALLGLGGENIRNGSSASQLPVSVAPTGLAQRGSSLGSSLAVPIRSVPQQMLYAMESRHTKPSLRRASASVAAPSPANNSGPANVLDVDVVAKPNQSRTRTKQVRASPSSQALDAPEAQQSPLVLSGASTPRSRHSQGRASSEQRHPHSECGSPKRKKEQ